MVSDQQICCDFKSESGHAVIMGMQILPDSHCVTFFAVKGAVNKFYLPYSGIQKFLQLGQYFFQRYKTHPFFDGG